MAHFAEQAGGSPIERAEALVVALYPKVEAAHAELSELDDFRVVATHALGRTSTGARSVELTEEEKAIVSPDMGLHGEGEAELDPQELDESIKRALKAWDMLRTAHHKAVVDARRDLVSIEKLDDRTFFSAAAAMYALDNPENPQAELEARANRRAIEELVDTLTPGTPVMGLDVTRMRGDTDSKPLVAGRVKAIGRTAVDPESFGVDIGMKIELARKGDEPLVVTRSLDNVLQPNSPGFLWVGDRKVQAFRTVLLGQGADPREVQHAVQAIGRNK